MKENCWFYSAVLQKTLCEKFDGVLVAGRVGRYYYMSATTRAIQVQFDSWLQTHA